MSAIKAIPNTLNRCSARFNSDLSKLRPYVKEFVEKNIELCKPTSVHVCDGSKEENDMLLNKLVEQERLIKLTKYENWLVLSGLAPHLQKV